MTFYFIAGEPSSFMTMANMAHIIKQTNPNHNVEAIVPYHVFLAKMEVQEFLDEFDRVWRLPACDFHKNIFRGILKGIVFKKEMKNIVFEENSIVFAFISMEMTINLLIKHINEKCKSSKIILLNYSSERLDITIVGGKFSWPMTLLNRFYSFILGCYPMKSYTAANGRLMHREYSERPPFNILLLSRNYAENGPGSELPVIGQIVLPYPFVLRDKPPTKRIEQFVVFFGDTTIADFYVQLDKQFLINKTTEYVGAIINYYKNKGIKVYYKPHPYDGEKIMKGCESAGLPLFKEKINAEMLFSKYHDSIVAAYTISSHSVLFGSKGGIPSYWAYEYCFTDERIKDSFREITIGNKYPLLKSITDLKQIGFIDDSKFKIDTSIIVKSWENGIKILAGRT